MKTENKKCLKTNNSIHRWLNFVVFTLCVDLWKESKRERGEESLCWAKHLPHFQEGSECRPTLLRSVVLAFVPRVTHRETERVNGEGENYGWALLSCNGAEGLKMGVKYYFLNIG
jgi:hypothetical protein